MPKPIALPSRAELRYALKYDALTGIFTWRRPTVNHVNKGDIAGHLQPEGYIAIGIKSRQFQAHRLAWKYVTGKDPKETIDHINGNKADNRFENLRPASQYENNQNRWYNRKVTCPCCDHEFIPEKNQ